MLKMGGLIPTPLFTAMIFTLAVSAGSGCDIQRTFVTQTDDKARSQPPAVQDHEQRLRQAIRESENDLLERRLRQLEKLQRQAEREAARAEKLRRIIQRS
ncbi:hypothetical protein ACJJIF_15310 [Microbulbifer sp. SSSA002]|uniref:hypothetical protein n=1 Tax=unclassified Microbulbifer TaxID=2619833 RepID=UPI00403A6B52